MPSLPSSTPPSPAAPPMRVAIVGGGIVGLCLGIGLEARGIDFTVYERARGFHEAGAGLGLSPNAERAMRHLSPAVHAAYEAVANPNGEDYFSWVNGLDKQLMFKLFVGEGCFRGCRRSDLVGELLKALPPGRIRFGAQLKDIVSRIQEEGREEISLLFEDGSTASADTVIGCDGIHSRVRELMFRHETPCAATYSHKYSFRALVPMDQARARLDERMCATRHMYNGPGAHIITYPVADSAFLNALAVISDLGEWVPPDDGEGSGGGGHTGRATREEAQRAFEGWHPDVRAIVELMPERMEKWAIFDMLENPAPRYHQQSQHQDQDDGEGGEDEGWRGGGVCLAGDAAHAVGPHLGAGAGFGIEDACLLADLLETVQRQTRDGDVSLSRRIEAALVAYSEVRYERTQWLVRETREAVDLFEWTDDAVSKNPERFGEEITWRFHKIWDYDIGGMLDEAQLRLAALQDNGYAGS